MFEYFNGNYAWNLAVVTLVEDVGTISEPAEAFQAVKHLENAAPEVANEAWYDAMAKLAARLERMADEGFGGRPPAHCGPQIPSVRHVLHPGGTDDVAPRCASHGGVQASRRQLPPGARSRAVRRRVPRHPLQVGLPASAPGCVRRPMGRAFGDPHPGLRLDQGDPVSGAAGVQAPRLVRPHRRPARRRRRAAPHGLPAEIETENYISKVVDYIQARPDIATDQIGLAGSAWGVTSRPGPPPSSRGSGPAHAGRDVQRRGHGEAAADQRGVVRALRANPTSHGLWPGARPPRPNSPRPSPG